FLAGITRDATEGQYEGEAFIGDGALLLLVLCVACSPAQTLRHVRRYWVLAIALLALAAYAASNVVYVGGTRLIAYGLPPFAVDLGNYFRASGRFIWPLAYALTILPVTCIARWWRPAPALAAAAFGVFLQVHDSAPMLAQMRVLTAQGSPDLIDAARLDRWLSQHQRLWQYPSWACGGLAARHLRGAHEDNRELQVQLAAARAGVPTNSVYTSRRLKDCRVEEVWASNPTLEQGVLYLLSVEAAQERDGLHALARSRACVTLEWAVACSRQWSRTAAVGSAAGIRAKPRRDHEDG
ncbi:MAG TPA: hypothetical protein VFB99_25255, partial [Vicinamibacterales bacterium]|nr:hypothetical protein [Vicinamibacterales bacterium]